MEKLNVILGFNTHIPLSFSTREKNGSSENYHDYIYFTESIIRLLKGFQNIKTNFHLTGNTITFLDNKLPDFCSSIRSLLDKNQIELLGGGIYEPILPLIPREDRQAQISQMSRLLNHLFCYTPQGAWISELIWDPSLIVDISKQSINYICLPKEHLTVYSTEGTDINESNYSGYFLTEEEGCKVAVFPIYYMLNNIINRLSPSELIDELLERRKNLEKSVFVLFFENELNETEKSLSWLKNFYALLEKNQEHIETQLLNNYFKNNKPRARIYIPATQTANTEGFKGFWKNCLLNHSEANLLHKKMLRVSKKINAAREGKSRFKVIKEMINQAQDLLLKGQSKSVFIEKENCLNGMFFPYERHKAYSNLIKAENLIDAASRQGSKWIQVSEIDYDCDGNTEIIIETETQNIYISPAVSGSILEHDFRPRNLNLTSVTSLNDTERSQVNKHLNLVEHFLKKNTTAESLTNEAFYSYEVEKIKAKEETCKITLKRDVCLSKLEGNPQIEVFKQISTRSGDSFVVFDYTLINKSNTNIDFTFAVELKLGLIPPQKEEDMFFYLNGIFENKTKNKNVFTPEDIGNISQISLFNKTSGISITFSSTTPFNFVRYPAQIKGNGKGNNKNGSTLLFCWDLTLNTEDILELSLKEEIKSINEEI